MKKLALMFLIAAVGCTSPDNGVKPAIPRDKGIEEKVEETLGKMSLDDKIGQMLELNIDVFGKMDWSKNHPFQMDTTSLATAIKDYRVGSFLNAPAFAGSVSDWQTWIPTIQKYSMEYLGIPTVYGLDNNHGSERYPLSPAYQPGCILRYRDGKGTRRYHRL